METANDEERKLKTRQRDKYKLQKKIKKYMKK